MSDPTPADALQRLRDALPANPDHDGPVEAAARVLADGPLVRNVPERRHVLTGDLDWLEYAIADYIARWGTNWTGKPPASTPAAGVPRTGTRSKPPSAEGTRPDGHHSDEQEQPEPVAQAAA